MERITYNLALKTTELLRMEQSRLAAIEWVRGEANLDVEFSELACECCTQAWNTSFAPEFPNLSLKCFGPDVNLLFTYVNGERPPFEQKIELKSSVSTLIPGSTIGMTNINQPLIYCLRPSGNRTDYQFHCSLYHQAMGETETDLFQDRTPRPRLNFERMADAAPYVEKSKSAWSEHYARCALQRVRLSKHSSWQDDFTRQLIDEYLRTTPLEELIARKQSLTTSCSSEEGL